MSLSYAEHPVAQRERHSDAPAAIPARPDYKRLLFMADYPPANNGGAAIIVKQLLRHYDMDRLDVLCGREWHGNQTRAVTESFLPCRHTTVKNYRFVCPRPRRIRTFRRQLMRFLESKPPKTEVYHLSISLYPVTRLAELDKSRKPKEA